MESWWSRGVFWPCLRDQNSQLLNESMKGGVYVLWSHGRVVGRPGPVYEA